MTWRWIEVDPWGLPVHCGEAEWQRKAAEIGRNELYLHEAEVLATVRAPDEIYEEPGETARLRAEEGRDRGVLHYISWGRTRDKWAGNAIQVVVKEMSEPDVGRVGYVRSIWVPDSLRLGKLQLRWRRRDE